MLYSGVYYTANYSRTTLKTTLKTIHFQSFRYLTVAFSLNCRLFAEKRLVDGLTNITSKYSYCEVDSEVV